ncbi:MAG: GH25 family lysozyme [Actinomycetota bacterium]
MIPRRRGKHSISRRKRIVRATIVGLVALSVVAAGGALLYERGFIQRNHPSQTESPVRGVDVSSFQRAIDWPTLVRGSKIRFAFIKASEGSQVQDKRFRQNWAGARGLVARSAYHFFTFCTPGQYQATNFLDVLPPTNIGELPPAVDVEFGGNCKSWKSVTTIRTQLQIFLLAVRSATHRVPILYVTGQSFDRIVHGYFDEYPLWVQNVVSKPSVQQFPRLTFWQYAANGRMAGVTTLIDLNVFVGAEKDFEALLRHPSA